MGKQSTIPIQMIDVCDAVEHTNVKVHSPRAEQKIYVRSVTGPIESIRRWIGGGVLLVFLILPWLVYQGQQAILLDFSAQRFHLLGLSLWPQDLTLLAWILIISAFSLFLVTVVWGRIWCGFVCPQTVFTFLFQWVEEKFEGARNKRIHLDNQPLTVRKLSTKLGKHCVWIVLAFITSFTFVGYFTPISELLVDVISLNVGFWPVFYLALFTACTYGNAGWMKELMCTHICPYSRFQSVMFDNDTLTVTYNAARGENRGPRPKKLPQTQYQNNGLGDCIDCSLCVQVCPTGIDIRNGLQYECINCGACVDACNDVMSKMAYPKGLISYTSSNGLGARARKLLRPNVVGYLVVLAVMIGALAVDLSTRKPFEFDVIRDRTALYRETNEGYVENIYTLVLRNKLQLKQSFRVKTKGLKMLGIVGSDELTVQGSELMKFPISIVVEPENLDKRINEFSIIVQADSGEQVTKNVTFIYL